MKYIISYSLRKGKPNIDELRRLTGNPDLNRWQYRCYNLTRSITNPWRVKALRKLTGQDPQVKEFILRCKKTAGQVGLYMLYLRGSAHSTLVLGCSGGKHRSVAIAEMVAERLRAAEFDEITVIHRDLPRKEETNADIESGTVSSASQEA